MGSPKFLLPSVLAILSASAPAQKKPVIIPARAKQPSPAVTDEFLHKQFGENCSLMPGPPQFIADLDADRAGEGDHRVAAGPVMPRVGPPRGGAR